jgi:hypothetical protein
LAPNSNPLSIPAGDCCRRGYFRPSADYTREEFLQLTLPEILHPDVLDASIQEVRGPISVHNISSRHIRKNGPPKVPVDVIAHSTEFQGMICRFVLALAMPVPSIRSPDPLPKARFNSVQSPSRRAPRWAFALPFEGNERSLYNKNSASGLSF